MMGSSPHVAVDITPVDTHHRTRGIGRYAQGLAEGLGALALAGELDGELDVTLLRAARPRATSLEIQAGPLPEHLIRLSDTPHTMRLWCERGLWLDRQLPPGVTLYHGTAPEHIIRRTPWVATCHDLIPHLYASEYLRGISKAPKRLWWRASIATLRDRAARVIAISEHVKQTLIDEGLSPDRIDVITHGVSPHWSQPEAPDWTPDVRVRWLRQEPFVLFIGGFDARKNFNLTLAALALLPRAERPILAVVGKRSVAQQREHGALVARHKLRGDVVFLEYVDDRALRWLYRKSRGLIFPSIEEGWGFPIVEAMAAGSPVVCANFGSMAEAAGGAALAALDVRQLEGLRAGFTALMREDAARAQAVARGLERAASLTWESSARALVTTYLRASHG